VGRQKSPVHREHMHIVNRKRPLDRLDHERDPVPLRPEIPRQFGCHGDGVHGPLVRSPVRRTGIPNALRLLGYRLGETLQDGHQLVWGTPHFEGLVVHGDDGAVHEERDLAVGTADVPSEDAARRGQYGHDGPRHFTAGCDGELRYSPRPRVLASRLRTQWSCARSRGRHSREPSRRRQ